MRARIVRVGNSRGIRLPKPLLEQSGLPDEVEIHAEPGRIIIESAWQARSGWAEGSDVGWLTGCPVGCELGWLIGCLLG